MYDKSKKMGLKKLQAGPTKTTLVKGKVVEPEKKVDNKGFIDTEKVKGKMKVPGSKTTTMSKPTDKELGSKTELKKRFGKSATKKR